MSDAGTIRASRWRAGVAAGGAAVLAVLLALPLAAGHRLPDRLATHWSAGADRPDDSMPLWAAALLPALLWAALVIGVLLAGRRADAWSPAALLSTGVCLVGAQASIVRANLDHAHWRDADGVTVWVVAVAVASLAAAGLGIRLGRRLRPAAPAPAAAPRLDIPPGERVVWLSRATSPWMRALAALSPAPRPSPRPWSPWPGSRPRCGRWPPRSPWCPSPAGAAPRSRRP
ncbi:hypothetical protein RB200_13255 [Streptomyces sp. PmtG]